MEGRGELYINLIEKFEFWHEKFQSSRVIKSIFAFSFQKKQNKTTW